jgi:hypothetical protein
MPPQSCRLETRVLPDERLEAVEPIAVEAAAEGVRLRTSSSEITFEGLTVDEMKAILAPLDGRNTLAEALQSVASNPETAETIEGVLGSLVGDFLRIRWDPARRPQKNVMVIDDFLRDAEARRAEALAAEYRGFDWFLFPGLFSVEPPDNVEPVMNELQQLVGTKLVWGAGPIHGRYRYSATEHRRRAGANVHVDPFSYNAVVCLTPTPLCRGGISFYRHEATGLFGQDFASFRASGLADRNFVAEIERLVSDDGPHEERWKEVDRVDLRFNRLVIFNPRLFHRTNSQFGDAPANARITQGFSAYAADDPLRFEYWI